MKSALWGLQLSSLGFSPCEFRATKAKLTRHRNAAIGASELAVDFIGKIWWAHKESNLEPAD
jgi:hypothetical protein